MDWLKPAEQSGECGLEPEDSLYRNKETLALHLQQSYSCSTTAIVGDVFLSRPKEAVRVYELSLRPPYPQIHRSDFPPADSTSASIRFIKSYISSKSKTSNSVRWRIEPDNPSTSDPTISLLNKTADLRRGHQNAELRQIRTSHRIQGGARLNRRGAIPRTDEKKLQQRTFKNRP